ncbi:MAG: hypothetical protein Tp136DCM211861_2 [Prokaryotic dsDNA virus sp.]|nr:MAG: hypothetical protein Tp136DCM211861_2 [Prokaryotic dsDNA virus sp.]
MLNYQIEVDADWIEIVIQSTPQRKDLQRSAVENGERKGKWVFRVANSDYGWSLHGPMPLLVPDIRDLPCVCGGQNRTPVYRRVAKCLEALDKLWLDLDEGAMPIAYVGVNSDL